MVLQVFSLAVFQIGCTFSLHENKHERLLHLLNYCAQLLGFLKRTVPILLKVVIFYHHVPPRQATLCHGVFMKTHKYKMTSTKGSNTLRSFFHWGVQTAQIITAYCVLKNIIFICTMPSTKH